MKLLWFSHILPYPPSGGASQRSFNLLREISRHYTVHLVAFDSEGLPKSALDEYSEALRRYCEHVEIWEMPIQWRQGFRWWVRLAVSPLSSSPYSCQCYWSLSLAARWKEILQKHQDFLLHFDSLDLALYSDAAASLPKVLNHHNCESALMRRRGANAKNPLKKPYLLNQAQKLAALERQVCPRFNVNTVCSDLDARALRDHCASVHTHLVENGVDTEHFRPVRGAEERDTLIFSGLLDWEPNVSGIHYFVDEIWPLIRRDCPSVRLYLAGRHPVLSVRRLQAHDRSIVVVPNPEDMRPWLARAAVYVCPLLEGGGTRIKLLDAMAMAKPVVSTSIGSEGLRVRDGENILVADTPRDFAFSILRLLNDKPLRLQLAYAGRALVERHYSWGTIVLRLDEAYRCASGVLTCAPGASVPAVRQEP